MKEYRKRFVQLNMLLIGIVLTAVMLSVAIYMYRDYYRSLRSTMEQMVEPLDMITRQEPGSAFSGVPQPPDGKQAPLQEKSSRTEHPQEIMTVFYTPGQSTAVLSSTSLFEGDTLHAILSAACEQSSDFGILNEFHAIYYCTGSGAPYKIALASTGYILHSMARL